MLSILDRYFLRELAQAVLATAIVLLTIFAGTTFAKVLQQVANGSYPASVMFNVLGLNMLDGLSNLLPLAAFLGMLQGLGRIYRESEMHVLSSSGMGPRGLLKPTSILAGVLAVLVAVVAWWLGPWSVRTANALIAEANRSVIAAGLDAGRFTSLPGGRGGGIIFVDTLSRDGTVLGRSFLATERQKPDGSLEVKMVTGSHGRLYQESDGNNRFLELDEGWQYDIPLGANNWRRIQYQRNDAALSNVQSDDDDDPTHALPTSVLLHAPDPDDRAEFAARITAPFMVLVLMMLALPMSRQSPREPRYGRLLLAVLTFFVYHALLAICQAQIAKGHWHRSLSLWVVDGLLFAYAAWLFQRQYAVRRPQRVGR